MISTSPLEVTPAPHITTLSAQPATDMTSALQAALADVLADRGSIDPAIYSVDGFCGRKFRALLNLLIRNIKNPRYLEVGVFKGATLCSALSENRVSATAIDNWSWDKDRSVCRAAYENIARFKTSDTPVTIIERDFLAVPAKLIGPHNVYFYDGDHSEKSQYDGIRWATACLDDTSIILVDDWNWEAVRTGTMNAIRDCGLEIEFMVELRTSFDNSIPTVAYGTSDWHNGFFGGVVRRTFGIERDLSP